MDDQLSDGIEVWRVITRADEGKCDSRSGPKSMMPMSWAERRNRLLTRAARSKQAAPVHRYPSLLVDPFTFNLLESLVEECIGCPMKTEAPPRSRHLEILNAIVREYIETGEPVGSRTI